jgi:hypothetical protein
MFLCTLLALPGALGNGSSSNSSGAGHIHGYSNATVAGTGAAANGAAAAAAAAAGLASSPELGGRFQRAARTVGDCLSLVKGLSPEVNSARSFREKCSNLLGAAIAASLALQEVRLCTIAMIKQRYLHDVCLKGPCVAGCADNVICQVDQHQYQ